MEERNLRKTRVGVVVSDKMDKTIVVAVKNNERHPLYNKIVKKTYKLKAHDENTYANSDYIARASRPCLNIDFEMPSCPVRHKPRLLSQPYQCRPCSCWRKR